VSSPGRVLAMNSRFDNNEASVIWQAIALDVKAGVEFLRKRQGIRKVVLFGHSGRGADAQLLPGRRRESPLLVSAMGAGTGLRDNEWLYDQAASRDKDFFVLEGATHNIEPCVECETRKGQFANCTKNYFTYLRDWINQRFRQR
jgi:hypothetical protein